MTNVTAAIILNENKDKVLIAKRNKGGNLGGKWEFPGGKIEGGETPEKCLQRELKEELNIEVEVSGFFTENVHSYEWDTIKLLGYFVNWTGGEVKLHVHEKVEWAETKELDSYDFAPADIPIVNELMKKPACKICSSNTQPILDEQFGIYYYYCCNCKLIFVDEDSIISPQEEMVEYEQHDNTLENEGYVNMFKKFIDKAITPYLDHPQNKRALDFGCGPGPVLAVLLRRMGLEVDIYDIYFAPEKVYENKTYDLITATEVFEHLKNPLETMKLLKDHLKEGGILAIMTLFHPENISEFNKWWYRRDPTHISFYRPETLKVLADLLELEVLMFDDKNTLVIRK